jgi:branched-chain amino acid transport system ATP-binding protein
VLSRIAREEGLASIIVEQNARKILAMTDRAAILERGCVVHQGDSGALRANAALLENFLGVSTRAASA